MEEGEEEEGLEMEPMVGSSRDDQVTRSPPSLSPASPFSPLIPSQATPVFQETETESRDV